MKLNWNLLSLTDCCCAQPWPQLPRGDSQHRKDVDVPVTMGCEVLLRDFHPWMWQRRSQKALLTSLNSFCKLLFQCCSLVWGQKVETCHPAHQLCLSPTMSCSTCPISPLLPAFYGPICPGLNLDSCSFLYETNFVICLVLLFNIYASNMVLQMQTVT